MTSLGLVCVRIAQPFCTALNLNDSGQGNLTVGGRITVQLTSSLTGLEPVGSKQTNKIETDLESYDSIHLIQIYYIWYLTTANAFSSLFFKSFVFFLYIVEYLNVCYLLPCGAHKTSCRRLSKVRGNCS